MPPARWRAPLRREPFYLYQRSRSTRCASRSAFGEDCGTARAPERRSHADVPAVSDRPPQTGSSWMCRMPRRKTSASCTSNAARVRLDGVLGPALRVGSSPGFRRSGRRLSAGRECRSCRLNSRVKVAALATTKLLRCVSALRRGSIAGFLGMLREVRRAQRFAASKAALAGHEGSVTRVAPQGSTRDRCWSSGSRCFARQPKRLSLRAGVRGVALRPSCRVSLSEKIAIGLEACVETGQSW